MLYDYDDKDAKSILEYAKKLEGKTFKDIENEYEKSIYKNYEDAKNGIISVKEHSPGYYNNERAKGELGVFLEKCFFGYEPNSEQAADFKKIGAELKLTPLNLKKNGSYAAGERLSITNISFNEPIEENFYNSHLWKKIKLILLIHYLRDKSVERINYEIKFVNYFTPPAEDLKIIIEDYNKINMKIKAGKAHELSESDTLYLGACTKGSTAKKSMRPQFYGDNILAKKRNFCFKRSYMDYVFNEYILNTKDTYESILNNANELGEVTFDKYIIELINQNIGKTDKQLCTKYSREYNNNKSQWIDLSFRMLGIKSNRAEEFVKAGIVVKSIRIEENGQIRESMSFPAFKFNELIHEEWESSEIYNYFEETRFLFVVFKKKEDCYELLGSQLWNMPYDDLNSIVKKGWIDVQNRIKSGISFKKIKNKIENNLPKKSDNKIIHIRPHAAKAAYRLNDGYEQGNVGRDANELPNGEWMTTQSFWINNSYILSQLKYK